MFRIDGTEISITRGDSATLKVNLKTLAGVTYTMQTGDVLILSVKESKYDTTKLIELTSDSSATFAIEPEDTEDLEFGPYRFDIELTTAGGDVYTVVQASDFNVCEEIS